MRAGGGGKTDDADGSDAAEVTCTFAELDFEACADEDGSAEE